MAFNRKGKRKITIGAEDFYWWVKIEEEEPRLHILGRNKKFNLEVGLTSSYLHEISLPDNSPRPFPAKEDRNPLLNRPFEKASPSLVREIITWYLGPSTEKRFK